MPEDKECSQTRGRILGFNVFSVDLKRVEENLKR